MQYITIYSPKIIECHNLILTTIHNNDSTPLCNEFFSYITINKIELIFHIGIVSNEIIVYFLQYLKKKDVKPSNLCIIIDKRIERQSDMDAISSIKKGDFQSFPILIHITLSRHITIKNGLLVEGTFSIIF